jgi:hypothetical protein
VASSNDFDDVCVVDLNPQDKIIDLHHFQPPKLFRSSCEGAAVELQRLGPERMKYLQCQELRGTVMDEGADVICHSRLLAAAYALKTKSESRNSYRISDGSQITRHNAECNLTREVPLVSAEHSVVVSNLLSLPIYQRAPENRQEANLIQSSVIGLELALNDLFV